MTEVARIAEHYDVVSPWYRELWGEHLHHGYYSTGEESRERATEALLERVVEAAAVPGGGRVLDVGCGFGGTCRWLARHRGCRTVGVTLSPVQAAMAREETVGTAGAEAVGTAGQEAVRMHGQETAGMAGQEATGAPGQGPVPLFLVGDAARLPVRRGRGGFDAVLALEVLSHVADRAAFFRAVAGLLVPGGRVGIAAWLAAPDLSAAARRRYLEPIEDGMLVDLPTVADYERDLAAAGLEPVICEDVSARVQPTWDLCLEIVADPRLWSTAWRQGPDVVAFLRSFRDMRRGFRSGAFRYGILAAEKPAPAARPSATQ